MDKKFIRSFLIFGGTAGFSRILPVAMLPIYLSSLGSNDYGIVEVVFAIFNCLIIFGQLQLETSLQRLYYKVDNQSDLFSSIFVMTLIASVLVTIVACFFSEAISTLIFKTEDESTLIVIAASCILFANISSIYMIVLRYMDRAVTFTVLSLGQASISALFSYFFIVDMNIGGVGYFYGLLTGWVFQTVFGSIYIFKRFSFGFHLRYSSLALSFAMPQFPARLASFFVQYANRFFVLSIVGVQAVALMSLSLKFAAIFQLLMLAFSMAWNPFIYKNENNLDLNLKVNKIFKCLLAILVFIHIITLLSSGFIINEYFNEEFSEANDYVALAIIPFQLLIIKEIVESGVKLANKTKYMSISYFVSAAFSGLLMCFSSSLVDILLSSISGTLLLVVLSWYFSLKNHYLTYSKLWFFTYLLVIVISVMITMKV